MFPRTISIVEIIFSKNTVDLRLRENIAIKSSPEELFLFISTFNKDGLNWVPALIKSKSEERRSQIVITKDPLKTAIIAKMNNMAEKINEVIAPNINIALLLKEVLFDLIKSEQASWKSFARNATNKTIIGPNIANGKIQFIWVFPYIINPIIKIIKQLIIRADEYMLSENFSNFLIISILVIFLRKLIKLLNELKIVFNVLSKNFIAYFIFIKY